MVLLKNTKKRTFNGIKGGDTVDITSEDHIEYYKDNGFEEIEKLLANAESEAEEEKKKEREEQEQAKKDEEERKKLEEEQSKLNEGTGGSSEVVTTDKGDDKTDELDLTSMSYPQLQEKAKELDLPYVGVSKDNIIQLIEEKLLANAE